MALDRNIPEFSYNPLDNYKLDLSNGINGAEDDKSLDKIINTLWNEAAEKGLFRYQIKDLPFKVLEGKYRFILQLNPDRAVKRRKPQEISNPNQPFNENEFNFNKISAEEILLRLIPSPSDKDDQLLTPNSNNSDHFLLINVSPLEKSHVLLTPFRGACFPQAISPGGLQLAIDLALLCHNENVRVGFNSLCGYASVNHEHYHSYELKHRLYLESASLKPIIGHCHELIDYPAPAFAFVLHQLNDNDMKEFRNEILKLTSYFQENEIAHNMFITRGSTLNCELHFDSIRVYLWARKSSFGAKECEAFNPALCELGGHYPCKNEDSYRSLTEDSIVELLQDLCTDNYLKIRSKILNILNMH